MVKKYIATFYCSHNGYLTVKCEGYAKDEKRNCVYPTVEEAIQECGSNAAFISAQEVSDFK